MKFHQIDVDSLSPKQTTYLLNAINKTPGTKQSLWEVLETSEIYVCDKGALCLQLSPDLMNIVLLGGENIKDWRDDLYQFITGLMKERNITHLCILGRHGWGSIFKELTPIGMIYTLSLI